MRKNYTSVSFLLLLLLFITNTIIAQVGIGTTTPNASAALDVTSTTQGMLTPRMTTAQRLAIATPADGLIVYDTDLKSFYHYIITTTSWSKLSNEASGRLNYKLVKSITDLAPELALGGGSKYLLNTSTYYEINGSITFAFPIDLNNAYISGEDANEDKLIKTNAGNLFEGTLGGTIRNVTITVTNATSKVFNLTAGATQTLILRDSIVAGCSNVGSITGFALVFVSIVQYVGNTTGIVYDGIGKLLLSNAAWFNNNGGTYEKLQGTFGLVQKQGGFSEVTGANVGFDVSANPTITGDAVMETVVFTGTLTTGQYVKPYTVGTYTGYNFNNSWNVRCAGIPTETDATATGNLFKTSSTTPTTTNAPTRNTLLKVVATTTPVNLFRFESATTGRLTYKGKKPRIFQVTAAISFIESSGGTNATYVFYFVKVGANGTTLTSLPETEAFIDTNSGFIQSFPISGTISLQENESVELFLRKTNAGTKTVIQVYSYNLSAK